jgi:hypothetical protein
MKPGRKRHPCPTDSGGKLHPTCPRCKQIRRQREAAVLASGKGLLCRACGHPQQWDGVLAMFICRCPLPLKEPKP